MLNDIVISLRGEKTISISTIGSILSIGENTLLIIRDLTLKGRKNGVDGATSNNNTSLISVEKGIVELKGSAKITGNANSSSSSSSLGGGVYILYGNLIMHDSSSISENTASSSSSDSYGGGVYLQRGTFYMYDNSNISKNSVSGTYSAGGGIFIDNSTFEMNDASSISENTTSYLGGGVYVYSSAYPSSFIMKGNSKVNNNRASNDGGGIYIYIPNMDGTASCEMYDNSSVTLNSASSGGGIYCSGKNLTMNNYANVSNNNATYSGGGIYNGFNLTMNDFASVSNNRAASGGGIYSSGNSIMSDNSIISYNSTSSYSTSAVRGVGVNVYRGTFTMKDNAKIAGNNSSVPQNSSSNNYGGGIIIENNGTLHLVSGIIYGYNDNESNSNILKDQYGNAILNRGSSLYKETSAIAQYGILNGDNFVSNGVLNTTDNTIIVENGILK